MVYLLFFSFFCLIGGGRGGEGLGLYTIWQHLHCHYANHSSNQSLYTLHWLSKKGIIWHLKFLTFLQLTEISITLFFSFPVLYCHFASDRRQDHPIIENIYSTFQSQDKNSLWYLDVESVNTLKFFLFSLTKLWLEKLMACHNVHFSWYIFIAKDSNGKQTYKLGWCHTQSLHLVVRLCCLLTHHDRWSMYSTSGVTAKFIFFRHKSHLFLPEGALPFIIFHVHIGREWEGAWLPSYV